MKHHKSEIGRANFTLRDYVKQYTNAELCEKWNNNIPLDELDSDGYDYHDNSQEIEALCLDYPFLPADDITGIISKMGDGDYLELYVSESSRPYDLQSIYHPLEYYL